GHDSLRRVEVALDVELEAPVEALVVDVEQRLRLEAGTPATADVVDQHADRSEVPRHLVDGRADLVSGHGIRPYRHNLRAMGADLLRGAVEVGLRASDD